MILREFGIIGVIVLFLLMVFIIPIKFLLFVINEKIKGVLQMKKILAVLFALFLIPFASSTTLSVSAVVLNGTDNTTITNANATYLLWYAATGGTPFYNESFLKNITNGNLSNVLGKNPSHLFNLTLNDIYYLDIWVNGMDINWTDDYGTLADRWQYEASSGLINGSNITDNSIPASKLELSINLSNATGYLWTSLIGVPYFSNGSSNLTITDINTYYYNKTQSNNAYSPINLTYNNISKLQNDTDAINISINGTGNATAMFNNCSTNQALVGVDSSKKLMCAAINNATGGNGNVSGNGTPNFLACWQNSSNIYACTNITNATGYLWTSLIGVPYFSNGSSNLTMALIIANISNWSADKQGFYNNDSMAFNRSNNINISINGTGNATAMFNNCSTNQALVGVDSSKKLMCAAINNQTENMTGNGTQNAVAVWHNNTAINGSQIYKQTATGASIVGNASVSAGLNVTGGINLTGGNITLGANLTFGIYNSTCWGMWEGDGTLLAELICRA